MNCIYVVVQKWTQISYPIAKNSSETILVIFEYCEEKS